MMKTSREEIVYLNGRMISANQAAISIYDHGFLYGDGLFETMRAYRGKIFALNDHMDRLAKSLKALAFKPEEFVFLRDKFCRFTVEGSQACQDIPGSEAIEKLSDNRCWEKVSHCLGQWAEEVVLANKLAEAYIRITVTRGVGSPGLDPAFCAQPTVLIVARPMRTFTPLERTSGVKVVIVSQRRPSPASLDPALKSLNYLPNVLAKIQAKEAGAEEGIFLNDGGFVTEGTVSNIFWSKDGILYTPALETGVLPGITRHKLLQAAGQLGIVCREGFYSPVHLYAADEVFLSNSGSEVIPVGWVDGRAYNGGRVGAATVRLWTEFRRLVDNECKSE